jgi:transporter family protein
MWIYLGVLSSVFLGLYDICKKKAVNDNAVLPSLMLSTVFGALMLSPFIIVSYSMPEVGLPFGLKVGALSVGGHLKIFLKSFIVASSWVFAYFAIKHLPISIASPIRASAPLWTLIGAIILFSEKPSPLQWVGIITIFISYYAFSVIGNGEGIRFTKNKWVGFIFAATLLGTASGLYDKYLINTLGFHPFTVQAWFSVYLVIIFSVVVAVFWYPVRKKHTPFKWRWAIPLVGILLMCADFAYFNALQDKGAMISILSVLRRGSVVISFVGGGIIFKEQNKRKKGYALLGVLTGVFLIMFFS